MALYDIKKKNSSQFISQASRYDDFYIVMIECSYANYSVTLYYVHFRHSSTFATTCQNNSLMY